MTSDEIMKVASQTKLDFETKTFEADYLKSLVNKYFAYIAQSYEDDLDKWIEDTLIVFPYNACELATAVLLDRIQTGKIVYGRYEHEPLGTHNSRKSHTFWAQTDQKGKITHIADITADQYNGPPVYVGALIQPWTIPDWSALD